jgi:beta-N-acetylhexosaminidase
MVSAYGLQMIRGLKESDVMATVKHFPGHGDTSVDSHYGLPMIPHDMERLINVELAPFIDAIEAGADALMTAHIIFSTIDDELPATLSYKVITELLREEIGYDGIVMTDEMRMNAIRNNFTASEAAVKAIQAGVDIVLYAESTSTSIAAYNGVIEAIEDGIITEERIDESVWRILDKKIKYGLMEDYLPRRNLTASDIQEHKDWNQTLIEASFTQPLGTVDWFDRNASTLLISTKCTRYPLVKGYSLNTSQNSLAMVGASLLEGEGATQVDSLVIETSLTSTQVNQIVAQAASYSQVIIAVENATTSQATLVNRLAEEDFNLLVVALKNPYDYLLYDGINHYVCTFGYFASTVEALIDLLLGRFEATGTLPVQIEGINNN